MKAQTINVQITKSPRQFEAVRLGLEASLEPGETVEDAIKAATSQLNALYTEMYHQAAKPAQAPQPAPDGEPIKRERLVFGDKRVQQIVARIEKEPGKAAKIMEQTLKYFEPDEQAMSVLELAANLNK